MNMKGIFKYFGTVAVLCVAAIMSGCSGYSYETVPGDPMGTRIYTLDNGLKVYMSVNKDEPRIQTYIAVRVGSKNDPAETTGLAHYFEHLMFKGTNHFGTQNYEAEKPLLDQIEQQFEVYRQTTDSVERKEIYAVIDSLSYEASKYAIPNEYDKLMAAIGATGTNAYTSTDVTCYVENIPSNQVENWAMIQADRFKNNVIRGFHTELETVYEEKNMSLTSDIGTAVDSLNAALYPHHPYGLWTVLGSQEHLKNPSITNIKNYYKQWYVPNNMAICMSGDFNPDEAIAIIDKYFGDMQPNPELPKLDLKEEAPITTPVVKEVKGMEAETLMMGWRLPGEGTLAADTMEVVSQLLSNGVAGLLDIDVLQPQKVLQVYCFPLSMADYSTFLVHGTPKEGQSLDEVKDIVLAEVAKLRNGDFEEKMLQAILNNFKWQQEITLESNGGRADMFVSSFINGSKWEDEVTKLDRMSKITKADIMNFANRYLKEDNYAIVYKRQGKNPNILTIDKPEITPIAMNRDTASAFLKEVQASVVKPIEPVFLDFSKDLSVAELKPGMQLLYKHNESNDLFELMYIFDMGTASDKWLSTAVDYFEFLGTSDMTPEEVKKEFYRLACNFNVVASSDRSYIFLSGLNENMPEAVALMDKLLNDCQVDEEAYKRLVDNILKERTDIKAEQIGSINRLIAYMQYGPFNRYTNIPSEKELKSTNPQKLVDILHGLCGYKHRVTYYGPMSQQEFTALINEEHKVPESLKDVPDEDYEAQETPEAVLYFAPYEANQVYMLQYSNDGKKYDPAIENARMLYNEYFNGGMNSIVFQEMRESRGLAYMASAGLEAPGYKDDSYGYVSLIATQNDKVIDAVNTFNDIIEDMPESEAAFDIAKNSLLTRLRTQRILKSDVIWQYIDAQDHGLDVDSRISLYDYVQSATLADVVKFQNEWVKGRTFEYCILGDKKSIDMQALKQFGTVHELQTKDIFGY
mgnify:CR=1 FL=1